MALTLHLGGVGKYVRQIWGWSVHFWESGDLHTLAATLIASHVVLHTMEFLEDTKEIVEVFEAHIFNTKVVYNKAELDEPPFVAPETRS